MQDNNISTPLESYNPDDELKMNFTKNKFPIKDEGDLTDSDIDDPKYVPTSFSNNNQKVNPNPIINSENINQINTNLINENFQNVNFVNNDKNINQNKNYVDPKCQLKITELMQLCKNLENEN